MSALPKTAPARDVLRRVASEVGEAAEGLVLLEAQVAALLTAVAPGEAAEKLQVLDRLTQQMRAVEVFLTAVAMDAGGDVSLGEALDTVLLESVRTRLAGGPAQAAPVDDVEFW